MTSPTAFYDLADTILQCVCAQMTELAETEEGYSGCPCDVFVSHGEPAHDNCCDSSCGEDANGQLTVHIESVYPSDQFPAGAETFAPCAAATWVASVVVTAVRCAPSPDEEGDVDTVALDATARLMSIDTYAVLQALSCCVVDDAPTHKRKRRVLVTGSQSQVDAGGCASVEVRALVEAGSVCGCSAAS